MGKAVTGLIQVAGVKDLCEAQMLVEEGVDWVGFPLRLESNPQDLSERAAARIVGQLPLEVTPVLITYETRPRELISLMELLGVETVQLHGRPSVEEIAEMRDHRPGLVIVKSLVVGNGREDPYDGLRIFSPFVDFFLVDTYDPVTGARGATGQVHDWSVSRSIVRDASRPVILAGGLGPENVASAIRTVKPYGVDAHTGLEEASGRKSRARVRRFVQEARRAFRACFEAGDEAEP